MANTIDAYNPTFYAQEALIILEQALGMARRVHRGYDIERKSFRKGDTIQIRQPMSFTAGTGGTSTSTDLNPRYIQMTVDQWKQVRFGLTDKELAYTQDVIINEHISPAVYALAHDIETALTNLYVYVPHHYMATSTITDGTQIIDTRKVLRDTAGNILDSDMVHFALDSTLEAKFLNLGIFHQAQIVGQQANQQETVMRGHLGTRFGVEHFVQQTLTSHTGGTISASAGGDNAGTLSTNSQKEATSLAVTALGSWAAGALKQGDVIDVARNASAGTHSYAVTADTALTAGAGTVPVWPKIRETLDSGNAVIVRKAASGVAPYNSYNTSIMFHKNAFAFATAPLPNIGDGAGARMSVVTDPRTGLSIRSRVGYDDKVATVNVTLDLLYGVKCLDPDLAVIYGRP